MLASQRNVAADHRPGEHRRVGSRGGAVIDDLAVAHDRDLVARRDHLGQLVADERDGLALVVDDAAQRGEEELRFGRRQHRGRLVEHQDLRIAPQALDDLDSLAQPGGEVGDAVVGIDLQAVLLADLTDSPANARRVQSAGVAERHVLPHGQRLDEAEVLVDHARCRARAASTGSTIVDHFAVQSDLAGVGKDQADQHLHQRRLAGAVLAEDAVDAAAMQREVDLVAGDDPPEPFGDVDELRGGRGVGSPPTR